MAELRTILYGIILLFNHISEYTTPLSAANPYLGRKPLPDILPSCNGAVSTSSLCRVNGIIQDLSAEADSNIIWRVIDAHIHSPMPVKLCQANSLPTHSNSEFGEGLQGTLRK